MSTNFKQHRLLAENYSRTRGLGLVTPQSLGIVSNRPDTGINTADMEESMRLSMKHMHGDPQNDMDDDDAMMNRHGGGDEGDDDDLGVDDDNDLDAAQDMDDLDGDDMGDDGDDDGDDKGDDDGDDMGDGDGDGDEDDMGGDGDDEYGDDEADELDGLEKKAPPMGRPHDSAAYMARHMSEAKKMPPWMNKDKGDDKGGDKKKDKGEGKSDKKDWGKKKEKSEDKGGDKKKGKMPWMKGKDKEDCGDKKNMKDGKGMKKGACKKCSSGMNFKESLKDTKPVDRMDKKEFAKKIAEQYWQADDRKYFSGVIDEDMLLPNKEQEAPAEPGPGEVGYAPQTRVGDFNGKALAEAVQHLIKKVEKLERKINQMF